jgi:hypothetical protein
MRSDVGSETGESGHFLWEERTVTWTAALSMNQIFTCNEGEEVGREGQLENESLLTRELMV